MSAKQFLDTNVLVYAFSTDPRSAVALRLLEQGCTISVQGLNEFTNIARTKLRMSWGETRDALNALSVLCPNIVVAGFSTHRTALDIAERHGLAIFDAAMVASALEAGCTRFWSEDMHHGLKIGGSLEIANPFRS